MIVHLRASKATFARIDEGTRTVFSIHGRKGPKVGDEIRFYEFDADKNHGTGRDLWVKVLEVDRTPATLSSWPVYRFEFEVIQHGSVGAWWLRLEGFKQRNKLDHLERVRE